MFAIDDATAVAVMPTPEAAGTPGFFTEGNPALGQAATYVRASFLNSLMQELLNLLAGAGITPSKTAYDQLLTGLRSNALITGNATGAANTYAVAYTPAITALVDGMVLWFKAAAANTGATTLNVNGLGAKAVVGGGHTALQGGEIIANGKCQVVWNATLNSWVLIECTGAALQVAAGAQSGHAPQLGQFTGTLAGPGYMKIPIMVAGVLKFVFIQWGNGTTSGGGGVAMPLPIAFPNACFAVAGACNVTAVQPVMVNFSTSNTVITAYASNGSGTGIAIGVWYIAIGF